MKEGWEKLGTKQYDRSFVDTHDRDKLRFDRLVDLRIEERNEQTMHD